MIKVDQFSDLFEFADAIFNVALNEQKNSNLPYNIYTIKDEENVKYIDIILPGYNKENIKVSYKEGKIIINAETNIIESGKEEYIKKTFEYKDRMLELPFTTKYGIEKIRVRYTDGILTIKIFTNKPVEPEINIDFE